MVGARTSRSARYGQVVFVLLAVTVSMLAGPVNVRSVSAQVALAPSTPAPTPTLAASTPVSGPTLSDPTAFRLPASAVEVVGKRALNAKHFRRADGSFTAVIAAGPLHYHAARGEADSDGGRRARPADLYVCLSARGQPS